MKLKDDVKNEKTPWFWIFLVSMVIIAFIWMMMPSKEKRIFKKNVGSMIKNTSDPEMLEQLKFIKEGPKLGAWHTNWMFDQLSELIKLKVGDTMAYKRDSWGTTQLIRKVSDTGFLSVRATYRGSDSANLYFVAEEYSESSLHYVLKNLFAHQGADDLIKTNHSDDKIIIDLGVCHKDNAIEYQSVNMIIANNGFLSVCVKGSYLVPNPNLILN